MSLRYNCTKDKDEDQEAARQMSSPETPLKNAIDDARGGERPQTL